MLLPHPIKGTITFVGVDIIVANVIIIIIIVTNVIIIISIVIVIIIIVIVIDQWRWIGRLTPPSISAPELLTESSIVLPEQMTLTMMMKTLMMIIMTISKPFETVCDQG